MLSLSQFRTHLFPLFKIQKATGAVFEVVYDGVVYDISVRKTDKKPKLSRAKKSTVSLALHSIQSSECPICGSLMFNGICMNRSCSSSSIQEQ